ncbi:hypothetical protein HFN_2306 [Helicobacter fennelliae MRY12-0050]|uniref:Uncharacterized protein n=1 Tax=Helicobacter fennelliae MRY12-0050 TaxID=1325130 RepID=T1DV24_9HELI|nr:hypothetical protein HFN_2306 [Helicobacter fennelliae MRY12-0050]
MQFRFCIMPKYKQNLKILRLYSNFLFICINNASLIQNYLKPPYLVKYFFTF